MQDTDDLPASYLALLAAQRHVTDAERAEMAKEDKRQALAARMRRRFPKVY